jgi:RecB family exonuclease
MAVRVQWVRYGPESAEALRAAVAAAKGSEPLAPVTVVVPSNHVGVAARRRLASGALGPVCGRGRGLAAATFVTPYRLAEILGAPRLAAAGRRPVSTPVLAAALRRALSEAPGLFGPVAGHSATEAALVAAYRELRDLSEEALSALAGAGDRAADVIRLHRLARAHLESTWYDEEDLLAAAVEALSAGAPVAAGLGAVVVHLPQRLSGHAGRLLRAIGETTDLTVVAGATGDGRADADVAASVTRIDPAAPPPPSFDPAGVVSPERTSFLTASDADDEVRAAVRSIVDAARAGTPLDRMAVLHASPEPYGRMLHEHLAAAGIPVNGASVVPLSGRVAGRAVLGLLALTEGGFRRQDVFAWLAGCPLLHDGRSIPVSAWERLSRDAAVVGGRDDWDRLLARLAEEFGQRATELEADPDELPWRAERVRQEAARARALRAFVLALVDELTEAAARPRRWGEHAAWAARLLDEVLGGPSRRDGWPDAERKAAERVELALHRLAALDSVEGPVGLDVFTRTLAIELDADLGRTGRLGEGVLVGSVGLGVGLDLDLVVLVGLAEGTFPAPVHDDSLLPDDERSAAGGQMALRRGRIEREHRELLAALAGAARHRLCLPRGDLRRSRERVASRFALDLASALAGERWWSSHLLEAGAGWVEHVPSFAAGISRLSFPATEQEYRLRSLGAGDQVLSRGAEVVSARRGANFTRFDGNLAGLAIPSPVARPTSPTRLERWAACPFAYLLGEILGVEPVENPEEQLWISHLERGNLVHGVLERFITEVLRRPKSSRPGPDQPWSGADRERMAAIGAELCADFEAQGLTGRPLFWRRDRAGILADLQRFLDADDTNRRRRRTRPLAAELPFGFSWCDLDAVPLPLDDGRSVHFRGKADRVDEAEDGSLHIVDYKTGKTKGYTGLSEEDPDLRGRKFQLPVYGAAARQHRAAPEAPVVAEYWFVSTKGQFTTIGYPVTDEVLQKVSQTLSTVVRGIEAGVFPSHPTAASTSIFVECPSCDPDGLGVTELRRAWERKRSDPALAAYTELAEPLEGVDPDVEVVGGD